MFSSVLAAGFTALLVLTGSAQSAEGVSQTSLDLEPAINGAVSASGLFPNQPIAGPSPVVSMSSCQTGKAVNRGALSERMGSLSLARMWNL